ncbi:MULTISPECIES: MarR family transcriptional regulator [Streptomyces]|uniref:MarR family winged helix-turn-helix transcriptional regulator n=1 Tax=Streptomyces TaxID=1883 RepID=UPI001672DCA7|nr:MULTISPECIES: MarR family transcriptional regulator [Streptomyces]WGP11595.1 MarR family transcriptional regulator [Streptomyces sp. SH5]GGP55674.1 MarR family transcriptional regulator [Streptomyces sindenensis]
MTINQQPRAASDQAMWEAVLGLHAFVERQLAHTLQRRYGVGLSEYRALETLHQAEKGECRMQELADHIGLGQSSVTRLVGRLDSAGYAYKDSCADDKRGVFAVITEEGRKRYQEARATYADVLSSALNTASADAQLARAVQALRSAA